MLEFAILGLLHEAPMHGYELRKRLFDMLGTLRAFSYGSLYPTLRRLLKAGLIVEDDERDPEDERAARAWGKRAKRVYKLTAEGKERFAEMLADVGPQAYDDEWKTGTLMGHSNWEVGDGPNHLVYPQWLVPLEYTRWGAIDMTADDVAAHAANGVTRLVVGPASTEESEQKDQISAFAARLALG